MGKLTEGHVAQIKSMREDGKKGPEIIEFFKNTYCINLDASEISRAVHNKHSSGVASNEKPRRRAAQRKYARKGIKPVKLEALAEIRVGESTEFVSHIHAAFQIHKKDFVARVEKALATV